MDCEQVVKTLWDYLDGELTDDRMTEVRAHLKACRGCFPHFDFEKEFLEAIAKCKFEHAAPDELRRKVMAKLRTAGMAGTSTRE
jgi:anti-sigma factor (TIGR02949 family)